MKGVPNYACSGIDVNRWRCARRRYKYSFPFFGDDSAITVDDNRVGPLYKHVFPPRLAPSISFVGLPFKGFLFPVFQLQSS